MSPSSERPNLLYILSDQHAPHVLGCNGDPVVRTPNLDRLAERGTVFDNVYCPSPLCVPSRMAMLTGRFPHETQAWVNDHMLDPGIPTFAHAMGAGGYRPILIGRMHSVGPDQLHGYAERYVGDHRPNISGGRPANHWEYEGCQDPGRKSLELSGPGQNAYELHDVDVTNETVRQLYTLGAQKRAGHLDDPFCMSVGYMLPHQPFLARRQDYEAYKDLVAMPETYARDAEGQHPWIRKWREENGIVGIEDATVLRARAAYWGLVTSLDRMIGQILDALEENNLAENTIIVYLSDHGEQVGEHGLWWKQTFYDYSARVPAIISWPGVVPEGKRIDRVASLLDFNATMLDMLGAPALPYSRGRSLMPLLTGDSDEWDDTAFCEFCGKGYTQRMVRSGDWKLCYYHGYPVQLFNLKEDPQELTDRAEDPECASIRDELTARVLDGWDPEAIEKAIAARDADMSLIKQWASNTQPRDAYRWELIAGMDYLES